MKSLLRKLSLFTIAVTAFLAFSCSPSTGGGGSGSNPLDNSNVKARYIAGPSKYSPDDYDYELINFYNDNTFAVYQIGHSKSSEMGTSFTLDEEYIKASGTYTGDPTKETSSVKLHITKELKSNYYENLTSYMFEAYLNNKTSIKITSSLFEYESVDREIIAAINNYEAIVNYSSYENVMRPVAFTKGDCSEEAIVLNWDTINCAKQFTIYFSKENDYSKAEKLGTTGNSSYNSYVVSSAGLEKNATYYFWIKAELITGDVSEISPAFPVKFTTVNAPRIDRSYAGRTFEFYPVSGATSYKIYRSTTNDVSTAELIDTKIVELYSSYIEYTDKKLKKSGTYYYWVTAVKDGDESNYSNVFAYEFTLEKVFISGTSISDKYLQIRWDLIDYSDSYYVYYNTVNDFETATKVSDTIVPSSDADKGSYSFFNLTFGERYYFWVQPVSSDPDVTYEPSDALRCKFVNITAPSISVYNNGDNRVKIWLSSGSINVHKIYRNTTDDISTATCINDNAPAYEYIYDPITESGTYYYWATVVEKGYESEYSKPDSVYITYKTISDPKNLNAYFSGGKINLTWDVPAIGNVVSYDVYASKTGSGSGYIKIKTVTTNSATISSEDTPAGSDIFTTSGTRYFMVKAKNAAGQESDFSIYARCSYTYYSILAPSSVTATLDYDTGDVNISWDAVSNARYYKVYYYYNSYNFDSVYESDWNLYQRELSNTCSFPKTSLRDSKYYTFAVKAVTSNDEESTLSSMSKVLKYAVDVPDYFEIHDYNGLNKLVITWDKSTDTGIEYEIYMSTNYFFSGATKEGTTKDNYFLYPYTFTGTKYFWIVAKHGIFQGTSSYNSKYSKYVANVSPTIGTEAAITETDVVDLSTETWNSTKLKACELVSGKNADFYKFQIQAGKKYAVKWNDKYQYDCSTKPTLDVKVSAYLPGASNNKIFNPTDSGSTSPQQFVSPLDGWVIIMVEPYSSSSTSGGTYELGVYEVE